MNYSKRIVCLANSRKFLGRCVAGRQVVEGRYGDWIRPVSARPSAEVSLDERRYENGADPCILDVIEIPMIGPVPKMHQTENHMFADGYWAKVGKIGWKDLPAIVENPTTLWTNGASTYNGTNDKVSQALAARLTNSLYLIGPLNISVQVQTEGGVFGSAKRRIRADFRYNGAPYNFIVTDPEAERYFLAQKNGVYPLDDVYLCVSLPEPFDGNCYKLVATIISEEGF